MLCDEKDISNQDCCIIKCAYAHSFGENTVRGRKWLKRQADVYLADVVRNIDGHGGPAGNYDGYMYDLLVYSYRPSKLPVHENADGETTKT